MRGIEAVLAWGDGSRNARLATWPRQLLFVTGAVMAFANRASLLARLILVCASVTLSAATTAQQTGDARGPEFDVASIKPNISGGQQSASTVRPSGLYVGTNVTLR